MAETELSMRLHRQLFRFLQVGLIGFAIDLGLLALLVYGFGRGATDAGLVGWRVVSFVVAIAVTFLLNAKYTFAASLRRSSVTAYFVVQGVGAGINLGAYTALVLGPLNDSPLLALVIGSCAATLSNFLLARRYVYNS